MNECAELFWKSMRIGICDSFSWTGAPQNTFPHSSIGWGILREMLRAAGLMRLGSILLLTNGAPSVTDRPWLQAADANAVKSPVNIGAVGTKAVWSSGFCLVVVACRPAKKNTLSRTIGPPIVPPNWLRFKPSFLFENGSGALKRLSRANSKALPWKPLVPDLVTALTEAPARIV